MTATGVRTVENPHVQNAIRTVMAGLPSSLVPTPRSFLGLLLAGFTLVTLPLVAALAYSAWSTERLAGQSRSAVFNASQAARASRSMVERIGTIERLAQQLAVLDDPEIREGYARAHRSFTQLAGEIWLLPLDGAQSSALDSAIVAREKRRKLVPVARTRSAPV